MGASWGDVGGASSRSSTKYANYNNGEYFRSDSLVFLYYTQNKSARIHAIVTSISESNNGPGRITGDKHQYDIL